MGPRQGYVWYGATGYGEESKDAGKDAGATNDGTDGNQEKERLRLSL